MLCLVPSSGRRTAAGTVDCELDRPVRCRHVVAVGRCGDAQERVREHRDGGPALSGDQRRTWC
jgi:hypothetical protein